MLNSSPITSWEGATAFFNWAGTGGTVFWFLVMVVLCCLPVWVSYKAENAAEEEYGE